jgi:hypothetical protein
VLDIQVTRRRFHSLQTCVKEDLKTKCAAVFLSFVSLTASRSILSERNWARKNRRSAYIKRFVSFVLFHSPIWKEDVLEIIIRKISSIYSLLTFHIRVVSYHRYCLEFIKYNCHYETYGQLSVKICVSYKNLKMWKNIIILGRDMEVWFCELKTKIKMGTEPPRYVICSLKFLNPTQPNPTDSLKTHRF